MWKGVDGIAETTWPGVYNRSALPGRDDYFELPDWNTYVEGGKRYDLTVPPGERFNQIEIRGAAYGALDWQGAPGADDAGRGGKPNTIATRPRGVVRSVTRTAPRTGGTLSFTNVMQEQPIQEIWAYDIGAGTVPAGSFQLDYTIRSDEAPTLAALTPLNAFIAGRYPVAERSTVVAMPTSGVKAAVGAGAAGGATAVRPAGLDPIVHILIPASFGDALSRPADRARVGLRLAEPPRRARRHRDRPARAQRDARRARADPAEYQGQGPDLAGSRHDRRVGVGKAGTGAHRLARPARPHSAQRQPVPVDRVRRARFRGRRAGRRAHPAGLQTPRRRAEANMSPTGSTR